MAVPASKDKTTQIIEKMFSFVGAPYTNEFVSQPEWYLKYSWTPEREAEFKEWLIRFLRTKYHVPKHLAANEAAWFMLHCGWTTNQEGKDDTPKTETTEETKG